MNRTRVRTLLLPIVWLLAFFVLARQAVAGVAREDDVVYNEELVVLRSEELAYPRLAASARIQGIVVVRVTLDDVGDVKLAEPLSGPKVLVEPSVVNARRWAFKPTRSRSAILVYDFRLEDSMCTSVASFSVLRSPNVSVIRACTEALNP